MRYRVYVSELADGEWDEIGRTRIFMDIGEAIDAGRRIVERMYEDGRICTYEIERLKGNV